MTIQELQNDLAAVLKIPVAIAGFRGGNIKTDSVVLTITGENAYKGDGANAERVKEISIDLYIAGPAETLADALIAELEKNGLPYRLNTVTFETDTNLMHYEFITEA